MSLLEEKLSLFGIRPGLERMQKIMSLFGNPHTKLKVILVTGTNGKGSTTSYIASILKEAGYKVGSYFSPHLVDDTERMRINGEKIAPELFARYERRLLELHGQGVEMTLFESLTAIAYLYFAENGCEYAVMEIGMGGTYDATNIAQEIASVITTIGLDHTKYLGKTLGEIARDKAGIIKTSRVCVTGSLLEEIGNKACEKNVPLLELGKDMRISKVRTAPSGTTFDYTGKQKYQNLSTRLAGDYQAANAALAVALCEQIIEKLPEQAIRKGIRNAQNEGRMQLMGVSPRTLLDGAHNAEGVENLVKNLSMYHSKKTVVVFGAMKDKDWKIMVDFLVPHAHEFVFTAPHMERAENPKVILEYLAKRKPGIVISESIDALEKAQKLTTNEGLVLVCGSLYLVGEILRKIKKV